MSRRTALESLAHFLSERHRGGEMVGRHPAGLQVEPTGEGWQWSFGLGAKCSTPLALSRRVECLARLLRFVRREIGPRYAMRFARAYFGPGVPLRELRPVLERVDRRFLDLLHRQRFFGGMGRFLAGEGIVSAREGKITLYHNGTPAALEAVNGLLPEPAKALEGATPLAQRTDGCEAFRFTVEGRDYFVKSFAPTGVIDRFKNLLRPSKALRSWRTSSSLGERGLAVPEVLAVIEQGRAEGGRRSWLVTEFAGGCPTLKDYWARADTPLRQRLLRQLGVMFGTLHRRGGFHGDTHWGNALVRSDETGRPRVLWIDLDCSRILPRIELRLARKDLKHFLVDLHRRSAQPVEDRDEFLRVWSRWYSPWSRVEEIEKQLSPPETIR